MRALADSMVAWLEGLRAAARALATADLLLIAGAALLLLILMTAGAWMAATGAARAARRAALSARTAAGGTGEAGAIPLENRLMALSGTLSGLDARIAASGDAAQSLAARLDAVEHRLSTLADALTEDLARRPDPGVGLAALEERLEGLGTAITMAREGAETARDAALAAELVPALARIDRRLGELAAEAARLRAEVVEQQTAKFQLNEAVLRALGQRAPRPERDGR